MLTYALTGRHWTVHFVRAIPTILFCNKEKPTKDKTFKTLKKQNRREHTDTITKKIHCKFDTVINLLNVGCVTKKINGKKNDDVSDREKTT